MRKIFNFIVDKRYFFLAFFLIVTGVSVYLMGNVDINNDMSKYLPKDSPTVEGVNISNEEFGYSSTLKVVFEELSASEINLTLSELQSLPNVSNVEYDSSSNYNKEGYTLFVVHIPYNSTSPEAVDLLNQIETNFPDSIVGGDIYSANQPIIPTYLLVLAFIIFIILLALFTNSWAELIIFIFTITMAVLINLGSNIVFDSVSSITYAVAAILQLCLSIDYSIILLNRYRQEKHTETDNVKAMKKTLRNAFPSIAGSSLTTIAGLLCLLFMSFQIGADMGLVLAKGILISLLTVFTVLPTLILAFDNVIEKTRKWSLHVKVAHVSTFAYKTRKVMPIFVIIIFALSFYLRGTINTSFVLPSYFEDQASEIFPDNNLVVLIYDNQDEENTLAVVQHLSSDSNVLDITSYSTTLGAQLSAEQLAQVTGLDVTQISGFLAATSNQTMSIYDFINLVLNNYSSMLTNEQLQQLNTVQTTMNETYSQLVSSDYSRMIITISYPIDSDKTYTFVNNLDTVVQNNLVGENYLFGNSVMSQELSESFNKEFILITLLTIVAIFVIVAVTFQSVAIPIVLVMIIQTAIFLSMATLGAFGSNIYFLALIIVQAVLMGATIDYGILFTSYFREAATHTSIKEAIEMAYEKSIHTILTSASILFSVTGLLGFISRNQTIYQLLRALAVGTASAAFLIIFVLPSILVLIHKYIIKNVNQNVVV
ncbi:MAG: MMPL family transporter [Candidatus Izimaplasma sp.]|nr:MMPL family transporter [Candidatus Izimaplasma bacterium]